MSTELVFPCTSCGLCCKQVGKAVDAAKKLIASNERTHNVRHILVQKTAEFPYSYDESGRCEKLNADNTCAVYDNRPDVCSVEKTWAMAHSEISKEIYFKQAFSMCQTMMAIDQAFNNDTL